MYKTFFLSLFMAISLPLWAQKDPKATEILDKVSEKYHAYESMRVKFDYIMQNLQRSVSDTTSGTFFTKGDKYKLFFMGNEVFFNGQSVTTLIVDADEATITIPDTSGENLVNPAELYNIYKKDFKYRYRELASHDENDYHVIDLFPENVSKKTYSRIRILIHAETHEIYSIKRFDKAGKHYTLLLKEQKPNVKLNNQLFEFSRERHPGVTVIDLRE